MFDRNRSPTETTTWIMNCTQPLFTDIISIRSINLFYETHKIHLIKLLNRSCTVRSVVFRKWICSSLVRYVLVHTAQACLSSADAMFILFYSHLNFEKYGQSSAINCTKVHKKLDTNIYPALSKSHQTA